MHREHHVCHAAGHCSRCVAAAREFVQEPSEPLPLLPAGIVLKTYENQTVDLAGIIMVNIHYEDQEVKLLLIIVKGADKAALFGLQWLEHIKLNWQKVCCSTEVFQTKVRSVRTEEEGR